MIKCQFWSDQPSERFYLLGMRLGHEAGETLLWKQKMVLFFKKYSIVNHQFIGSRYILSKNRFCNTLDLLHAVNLFSSRYTICWSYIFTFFWEIFKFWNVYVTLVTNVYYTMCHCTVQRQPSRGVRRTRCSETMLQILQRTPMLKCDFTLWQGCSHLILLHIFKAPFPKSTSGRLLDACL